MASRSNPNAPQVLLTRAAATDPDSRIPGRLRLVSALIGGFFLIAWLTSMIVGGDLRDEFAHPDQWIPSMSTIAVSSAVFLLASRVRLSAGSIMTVGLLYQVAISYSLAAVQYLGAFARVPAELIHRDLVGGSFVVVWMLMFTVLVPARPTRALVALLGSATAVPVIYRISVAAGTAPAISTGTFFLTFVLPYALAVAIAFVMARIVHQLGMEVQRARELGSYQLESLIGSGGMGEVWRANHRMLARPAAIKLIRPQALAGDGAGYREILSRFEQEAQVTASLQSPHTVELYDFGAANDGTLYYVMELLDGIDLDSLVRRFGPQPAERVVHVLRQACASLDEAHHRGLVHRDVKPANILLCRRALEHDFVKVLDFGLVKRHLAPSTSGAVALSRADVLAGTPSFMAPEQILQDSAIDGRADIYLLGCVGYWLLTGTLVFEEASPPAAMAAHLHRTPAPLADRTEVAVPQQLDDLIARCLAKDPSQRPATAGLMAEQLALIPLASPWTATRAADWWRQHIPAVPFAPPVPRSQG